MIEAAFEALTALLKLLAQLGVKKADVQAHLDAAMADQADAEVDVIEEAKLAVESETSKK